ncbi:YfhO family protein [Flavobacterium sp. JP2137]|uniref:YfhO family protein n=1 Tax=Flavobacterium sp. JP2137 TaxID=3414510 RepID=UPI003D2FD085
MKNYKVYLPHLLALVGFMLISLIYFSPVLSGKVIKQSDIVQYTGMAKEQNDFRSEFHEEPYWTNSAFGGMPTYQLGAQYPHNYIKKLDNLIRFLPRPADYLFVYFLGFYLLLISLRINPLKAFFGALAFGFSTYLIIILGVGHNAKAHAIAYMPMLLAGVLLVFRKKYIAGGLLTAIAAALEINANHFQMTYYLLLLLLVVGIYYVVVYSKARDFKGLGTAVLIFLGAAVLSIGVNATNLMATAEYTKFSTRSNSELSFEPDGSPKTSSNAMSYAYITEYSYGIFESLNIFVPRLTGGASIENVGKDSQTYKFVSSLGASPQEAEQFAKQAPTYWGDQTSVAAPAYIGAIVMFLAVLALFVEKRKFKYIFLVGGLCSLLLSWGRNFPMMTDFFIDFFPMYNKFRAVSSIQVILELCMPILAVLGLQAFVKAAPTQREKALKLTVYITGGLVILLFLIKGSLRFSGVNDGYYSQMYGDIGPSFIDALMQDRKSLYTADLIRTGLLILSAFGILWFYSKEKIKSTVMVVAIGVLMVGDLVLIDLNYVNKENFVTARTMTHPFEETPADAFIKQDKDNFRVYEVQGGLSSARASFFHHSIGGYHAAKPRRIQQLFDYQLAEKSNMNVLNMLNVKYVIQKDEQGQDIPMKNDQINGNAWFVSQVKQVETPDQEMKAMDDFDAKTTAIYNAQMFKEVTLKPTYAVDSLAASIRLVTYKPNYLKYESTNPAEGLAVFSEVYYPHGWQAYIDGNPVAHVSVDYVLRALPVPAGKHEIEFKFEPQVVKTGSTIALMSSLVLALVVMGSLAYRLGYISKKKK